MNPATHRRLGTTMHVKTNLRSISAGVMPSIFAARASPLAIAIFALPSAFLRMFSALLRAFTRIISALA